MATDLREQQRRGTRDQKATRPARGDSGWPFVVGAMTLVVVAAVAILVLGQGAPRPEVKLGSYAELALTEDREGGPYVESVDPCYVMETIPGRGGPAVRLPCEPSNDPTRPPWGGWEGPYACTVSPPPCWDLTHKVLVEDPRG